MIENIFEFWDITEEVSNIEYEILESNTFQEDDVPTLEEQIINMDNDHLIDFVSHTREDYA